MNSPDDDTEKQHEPTQKKLEDARKKGEVPRSADLTTAASYAGFYIVAGIAGTASLTALGNSLSGLIEKSPRLAEDVFGGGGSSFGGALLMQVALALLPWFAIPALAAILTVVAQRALVFAPSKLAIKANRISLIANARNKFGRQGLFEFAKSFAKLLLYSAVLGLFLAGRAQDIIYSVNMEGRIVVAFLLAICVAFLLVVVVITLALGVLDLAWQRAEHLRKNRMSHKELTDEAKQMEGDPHIRQQRRQKGYEIATNRMLADVPSADVVIVNPTHYAVALKWSRKPGAAPVCVAKGVDEIAARIREAASAAGVPIRRDPATARELYNVLDIGEEIWPQHYAAVAAAIRFAEEIRRKAGKGAAP